MKKCPHCAEEIRDDAKVCRFCGRKQGFEFPPIGCGGALVLFAVFAIIGYQCSPRATPTENAAKPEMIFGTMNENLTGKTGNAYSAKIAAMDPQQRRDTFRRLMISSGERCEFATETMLNGAYKTTAFWNVRCSDSGDWQVAIEPDSSTKLLHCSVIKKLKDDCWKAY